MKSKMPSPTSQEIKEATEEFLKRERIKNLEPEKTPLRMISIKPKETFREFFVDPFGVLS